MEPGARVHDRYEVLSLLGRGGSAAVYSVRDLASQRTLALKQLDRAGRSAEEAERDALRFRREFHTMAGLVHPNIVEVYHFGVGREGPYYTMELVSGQDLRALGKCPIPLAVQLLRDVASALALLHARHWVHRDVGPRNVRQAHDGSAKLLDFGVLATSGVAGEIAGTPPCIAPETARLMPIDHKADLYSLGALAYWLLTGRHAYPAKTLLDLKPLWAERPPRPVDLRPEVPAALNDLVLSMMSLDPLGRPSRAAEVIDRLTAIGDLDPTTESELSAGQGYLLSASIVGRHREVSRIRELAEKAAGGRGGALLFEAPLGEGKSRLLSECRLQAELAGMDVVFGTNDQRTRGPYGLLRELTSALIAHRSRDVYEAAAPHAAVLGRALPEVAPHGHVAGGDATSGDPRQDRMRLQSLLTGFFLQLARQRAMAIVVDDLQRADEGSAAVLAQLAHAAAEAPLFMALALGTDEAAHAQAAVLSIQDAAERVRLQKLSVSDVGELVVALFGETPHANLAAWMHEATLGSPLRLLDLARHLVDKRIIRYEGGLWSFPDRFGDIELPPSLPAVMERKIKGLSAEARSLAEALAVHAGKLPLSMCVALCRAPGGGESEREQTTFALLDTLVFEEVLLSVGDTYQFRHEGLREALLGGMSGDRLRGLHLQIANLLTARSPAHGDDREAEIGWHFYHGGEQSRAMPFLASAGRKLLDAQSFHDAVPLIEAALATAEALGDRPEFCLDLRRLLVIAGVMCDRKVLLRYAEDTFRALRKASGVDLGERIAAVLGRKIGLVLGLLWATIRYWLTPKARRGHTPRFSLATLGVLVTATASAYSLAFDLEGLRRHLGWIDLFRAFPSRLPYASHLLCQAFLGIPLGRWRTVRETVAQCLRITEGRRAYDSFYRRNGLAAAHYILASGLAGDQDPSFEREAEEVKKQDLRFFDVSVEMVRLFYHRLRGEEEIARAIESRVELLFVQLGSMWIFESQLPWISGFAFAITRDVLGLKRTVEKLDRLCKAGYAFEPFLDIARGEYFREREQLDAAHAALKRALAALPEEELFRRQRALSALAEVLLAQGRSAEAERTAREAYALSSHPDIVHVTWRMRCGRVLALALAANGDVVQATSLIDNLLQEVAYLGSPTMNGSLHEARAKMALLSGDQATYTHHAALMSQWFRGTKNPALIARCDRLAEASAPTQAGAERRAMGADAVTRRDMAEEVAKAMHDCPTTESRARAALDLLLDATSGTEGCLFLREGSRLRLTASTLNGEPPPTWLSLLERAAEKADEEGATVVEPAGTGTFAVPWTPVVLSIGSGASRVVVGAAAIVQGAIPLEPPNARFVAALARELLRSDDHPGTVSMGTMTL